MVLGYTFEEAGLVVKVAWLFSSCVICWVASIYTYGVIIILVREVVSVVLRASAAEERYITLERLYNEQDIDFQDYFLIKQTIGDENGREPGPDQRKEQGSGTP